MDKIVDVLPIGSMHVLEWTVLSLNPFQPVFDSFTGTTGYVWAGIVVGVAIIGFLIMRR